MRSSNAFEGDDLAVQCPAASTLALNPVGGDAHKQCLCSVHRPEVGGSWDTTYVVSLV